MMPTLLYGCETWSLSKKQQSRIQATQMNDLRRIEGLSRWELKMNWRKTKMMRVARKSEECEVKIGEETIEQVDAMMSICILFMDDVINK